jgi:hypothetical protein
LLLAGSIVAESQSPAVASNSSDNPRIALSITTKLSTYKPGEKVLINIIVKNVSDKQYCENHFWETGEAELNGYSLEVVDANGNNLPLIPQTRERGMRSRGNLCFDPGSTIKESLLLDRLVDLNTPGVYRISVGHIDHGKNVRVISNNILVTIAQ